MFAIKIIVEAYTPPIDPEKPWSGTRIPLLEQTTQEDQTTVKERLNKIIKAVNDL